MRTNPALPGLLLLALALPAAADWRREYDLGLRALEAGDAAEAEARFRKALGEDAKPSAKKQFQGVRFAPYVPHYYAGLAAFRQGHCEDALGLWSHDATRAVLADLPEQRQQRDAGVADCERRLAAASQPASPAVAQVPSTKPPAATTPPPSSRPAATPAPKAVAPVAAPASAPTRPATATAAVAAPAELRAALAAWFAGRYADVAALAPPPRLDARSRAHLFWLRAAAAYTRAVIDADDDGLDASRRDIREARRADAAVAPDALLFSPRFREFARQVR